MRLHLGQHLSPTLPVLLLLVLVLLMVVVSLRLLYHRVDQGDVGHCGMVERQYYEDASVLLGMVARWV